MTEKLLVPDIGDFENVEVIEILVEKGQQIEKNDPVVTIESDKSSVEIPSTLSGKVDSISVKVGDKVSKGDFLLSISGSNPISSSLRDVPKITENLIQEAESSLKKNQEQKKLIQNTKEDKPEIIKIVNSVKKTSRLITCEEGFPFAGVGAEIAMQVMEQAFDWLDAPVARVTGKDVPMPYAANLEAMALPQIDDIVATAITTCEGFRGA